MQLIRARQRVLTAILPHNGNRQYYVPSRPQNAQASVPVPGIGAPLPNQSVTEGVPVTPYVVGASFTGVSVIQSRGLPPGLYISPDGTGYGTPALGSAGVWNVDCWATSATGRSANNPFTVTVAAAP